MIKHVQIVGFSYKQVLCPMIKTVMHMRAHPNKLHMTLPPHKHPHKPHHQRTPEFFKKVFSTQSINGRITNTRPQTKVVLPDTATTHTVNSTLLWVKREAGYQISVIVSSY